MTHMYPTLLCEDKNRCARVYIMCLKCKKATNNPEDMDLFIEEYGD